MSDTTALSRSRVALDEDNTLIAVVEMSQSSWLVAGLLPGVERDPLKELSVDERKCCCRYCIAGGMKPRRLAGALYASASHSKPAVTDSGWLAG